MNNTYRYKIKLYITVFFAAIITFLSACSTEIAIQNNTEEKLDVVSTTTMIYDLVSIIGGENINSVGLMNAGIDPHLYKATAGDVAKMSNADVVIYNGFHLEGKMGEVFSSLNSQGKNVICLEDCFEENELISRSSSTHSFDPHIWFDVSLWKKAAKHVAENLSAIDSNNANAYAENLENYISELDDLDEYVKNRSLELKPEQQVLITAHDAFGYFGKAYGFEVLGLQGISTQSEAGTSDVSSLAKTITENKIKAIFVETSISPKNIEALKAAVFANGFQTAIGGTLYSDSLGDLSSGHESYIKTFKANIDTIVDALK